MRKNILIFCHHYATQFIDVCNQYVSLFDRERYHVTVLYLRGAPDETARQRTAADEVIFMGQSDTSVRGLKLKAFIWLLAFCRKRQFSMVICHRYKPSYLMLWVAQFIRVPTLFYVMHDLGTFRRTRRQWLVKILSRSNMYFAGVSDAVRDDMRVSLKNALSEKQVITLYNCIDMPALERALVDRTEALRMLGIPPGRFVFGTLGRLEKVKDQATMLRAFSRLQSDCPDAVLAIAGIGSQATSLIELAAVLGLSDRVIFTGFVDDAWRYLRAFDVFLLTSLREAFGRVLPEAMTARVPVIGVTTDGIPEVIGKAGRVLTPGDDVALSDAMRHFYHMTAEERAVWGERGYQQIESHFSLPRFNEVFWALSC